MSSAPTIIHLLERNASELGERTAYRDRLTGTWRSASWQEMNRLTRQAGRAMIALGLGEGDVVTILGANRPEWTLSALAAMRVGGIAAGIYTTNAADEVAYIVNHAESRLLVVENEDLLEKVTSVRSDMPTLEHIVLMRGADAPADDPDVRTWEDFLAHGDEVAETELDDRLGSLTPDRIADLIYTSGTTGPPKAVMLTHDNLVWTAQALAGLAPIGPDDVHLSYLPLAHIAEQLATLHLAMTAGYQVDYCHDGLQVADFLKEVRPTFFFGVPRVWERFHAAVATQLDQASGAKGAILAWARGVASRVTDVRNRGEEPAGLLAVQSRIADKLVFDKLRAAIGLDRTRTFISGAAPTPRAILEFFGTLGIRISELYGQSEDTGPTTSNRPDAVKFGTVGPALEGVEVRLADDGEILVRGRNVFAGYFKDEAATAATLVDGWLHSGDLGSFDSDGFLSIVGRKKDIIITSGGKNVAPRNLEEALSGIDLVAHAVCVGEQRRWLIALLTLEPDAAARFAADHGIEVTEVHQHPLLRERLDKEIEANVNGVVARVEHIRNYRVLDTDFTPETGELTPTLKLKRAVVNRMYAAAIDEVYAEGQRL